MRSYDGVNYQYISDDAEKEKVIGIIANLIGFRPKTDRLAYSLSFYAGGIGVDDRLAVSCLLDNSNWPAMVQRLRLKRVSEISDNPIWEEEFRWLVGAEETEGSLEEHSYRFINTEKHDFQYAADQQCEIFLSNESDVNSWCVVWRVNGHVNYLSFEQG
ncbi:conserved hypothetical protein [Pseudomonas sp. 8BK]|uniref:hypothetical protein n=1 Tax=Pseudomonas sp. 8BK TaxID=2653164 RepID=UPI0012F2718A|nr:hypothetical protein [Pseudomonas sp. 8BK]VXC07653.1 conserved hypothetical protein [Pseudomonas sp. 8BK]